MKVRSFNPVSLITKLFIVIIIASFAFWGINDVFFGGQKYKNTEWIVKVGERTYSLQDLYDQLQYAEREQNPIEKLNLATEKTRRKEMVRSVVDRMVDSALLEFEAQRVGIQISDKLVSAEIRNNPIFQHNGKFSQKIFHNVLKRNNLEEKRFIENIRQEIAQRQLMNVFELSKTLVPYAFESIFAEILKAPRVFDVYFFDDSVLLNLNNPDALKLFATNLKMDYSTKHSFKRLEDFLKANKQILDELKLGPRNETLTAFLRANKADFLQNEKRKVKFITFDRDFLSSRNLIQPVGENELRAEYERNKKKFKVQEMRSIQQIVFPDEEGAYAVYAKLLKLSDSQEKRPTETLQNSIARKNESQKAAQKKKIDVFIPSSQAIEEFTKILKIQAERGFKQPPEKVARDELPHGKALFTAEKGSILQPVETALGWTIFYINGIFPKYVASFQEKHHELEAQLKARNTKIAIRSVGRAVEKAIDSGELLNEIAARYGLKINVAWIDDKTPRYLKHAAFNSVASTKQLNDSNHNNREVKQSIDDKNNDSSENKDDDNQFTHSNRIKNTASVEDPHVNENQNMQSPLEIVSAPDYSSFSVFTILKIQPAYTPPLDEIKPLVEHRWREDTLSRLTFELAQLVRGLLHKQNLANSSDYNGLNTTEVVRNDLQKQHNDKSSDDDNDKNKGNTKNNSTSEYSNIINRYFPAKIYKLSYFDLVNKIPEKMLQELTSIKPSDVTNVYDCSNLDLTEVSSSDSVSNNLDKDDYIANISAQNSNKITTDLGKVKNTNIKHLCVAKMLAIDGLYGDSLLRAIGETSPAVGQMLQGINVRDYLYYLRKTHNVQIHHKLISKVLQQIDNSAN